MTGFLRSCAWRMTVLLALTFCTANSGAYSVLTHQESIDLARNDSIRPLLPEDEAVLEN